MVFCPEKQTTLKTGAGVYAYQKQCFPALLNHSDNL